MPDRRLVHDALAREGIEIDPAGVSRAHYRAVLTLDREPCADAPASYLPALCAALGITRRHLPGAVEALSRLADRGRSGEILWSEAGPQAQQLIAALTRAGIAVLVVTNSDGHAAENLRDAAICQAGAGPGAAVLAVIDSALVGSAKPDAGIFRVALRRADAEPAQVVHVGDRTRTDIDGARAAGIAAIHLDPYRFCRARDHRHIRTLRGIWRHIAPAPDRPAGV